MTKRRTITGIIDDPSSFIPILHYSHSCQLSKRLPQKTPQTQREKVIDIINTQMCAFATIMERSKFLADPKKLEMVTTIGEYHVRRLSLDVDKREDIVILAMILSESHLIAELCSPLYTRSQLEWNTRMPL